MDGLYGETEGQGSDVVILHGLMGSCANWRRVRHALAARYRVTCLDFPNHGRSPRQETFSIRTLASDVMNALAARGIARAALVGHSMGGRVAMLMASEHPDCAVGLCVVDMTVKAFKPVFLFVLRACRDLPLERFSRRAEIKAELEKWIPSGETCDFLLKNVSRSSDGRFFWRVPLGALIRCHAAISDAPPLVEPYTGPAEFIVGGASPFHVMRDADAIRKWFPAVRFTEVPGAGHQPHWDQPARFLEALSAALERMFDPARKSTG